MSHSKYSCIDAGTENCPCYLALTGDCLSCSRLQGNDCCDCNWRGVCIYNEFIQGNRRINNPRKETEGKILEKKFYMDDLAVLALQTEKGFALKAGLPGSYVFLRKPGAPQFYDTPISVMAADPEKGELRVVIKVLSAKTKELLSAEVGESLLLRGIYRNGLQGLAAVMERRPAGSPVRRDLLISKGTGLAAAAPTLEWTRQRDRVDLIIDTEKISEALVRDHLLKNKNGPEAGPAAPEGPGLGSVTYLSLKDPEDVGDVRAILERERYDFVGIFASDYYVETLGALVRELLPGAGLAVSNNFRLCCGEGVCGACCTEDAGGEVLRMCKCQKSSFLTGPDMP